jgi:hypothetical protein
MGTVAFQLVVFHSVVTYFSQHVTISGRGESSLSKKALICRVTWDHVVLWVKQMSLKWLVLKGNVVPWSFSQGDGRYLVACLYKYYYNGSKDD